MNQSALPSNGSAGAISYTGTAGTTREKFLNELYPFLFRRVWNALIHRIKSWILGNNTVTGSKTHSPQRTEPVKIVYGKLIKVTAGKRHAWFETNVGPVRLNITKGKGLALMNLSKQT